MKATQATIVRFLQSEDGPTATEYAVLIALICVGVIGVMSSFGGRVGSIYTSIAGTMPGVNGS
jgi:pilus assembly protein Flp/PilA